LKRKWHRRPADEPTQIIGEPPMPLILPPPFDKHKRIVMTKRFLRPLSFALFACFAVASSLTAADLSITAASVHTSGAKAKVISGTAGATITAGQTVYYDSATNTYKLADADSATAHGVAGIALNGASSGQPLSICTEDPAFVIGATLVIGDTVWQSATAGAMTKVSTEGIASANYVSVMGVAVSTTAMAFHIISAGAVKP
jgi:hypothetical protein